MKKIIFILLAALSFQANAQSACQAGFTFTINTNTVTFTNTSTGAIQPFYYWSFGDGSYSMQTNPIHTYSFNGTFIACVTLDDSIPSTTWGCHDIFCDTIVITNAPVTGIEESANTISSLHNYPNPFHNTTNISYTLENSSYVSIAVYNQIGSKVADQENSEKSAGRHELEWNAEALSEGIYFLEVKANNSVMTKKLVIIKK